MKSFLSDSFPDIDDWKEVYEYHDYYLRPDTYDPMSYSFRDMYMPSSLVILDTEKGDGFDRMVLSYFDNYYLFDEGEYYLPVEEMSLSYYLSNREDWESDNFKDAEKLCSGLYYQGIWFKEDKTAALFPGAGEEVLFLRDVEEEPPSIFSMEKTGFKVPGYENGMRDYFVVTNDNNPMSKGRLCLYNSETKLITPFESASNSFIINLEKGSFCINNKDSLAIYDLQSSSPSKPVKILSDFKNKPAEITVVTTDRNSPNLHALAYKDEKKLWNVLSFETNGNIISDYPLGINISYIYDYGFNFHDGIIYIDNMILNDNYRFATNVSPDVDHTCHLVEIARDPLIGEGLYVKPIFYPILCDLPFEDVKDIRCWPQIAERIFDMLETDKHRTFWDSYPEGKISFDGMMEYINLFFDVDKETVVKNTKGISSDGYSVKYERNTQLIPEMMWMSGIKQEEGKSFFTVEKEMDGVPSGEKYKVYIDIDESYPYGFKYLKMEKVK